jgi:hypothetical protein
MKLDEFDPEILDEALVVIIRNASKARDAFLTGEDRVGREAFDNALFGFAQVTHQLSLKPSLRVTMGGTTDDPTRDPCQ